MGMKVEGGGLIHQIEQFFERVNLKVEYYLEKLGFHWDVKLTKGNLKSYEAVVIELKKSDKSTFTVSDVNQAFQALGEKKELSWCQSAVIAKFVKERSQSSLSTSSAAATPKTATSSSTSGTSGSTPPARSLTAREPPLHFNLGDKDLQKKREVIDWLSKNPGADRQRVIDLIEEMDRPYSYKKDLLNIFDPYLEKPEKMTFDWFSIKAKEKLQTLFKDNPKITPEEIQMVLRDYKQVDVPSAQRAFMDDGAITPEDLDLKKITIALDYLSGDSRLNQALADLGSTSEMTESLLEKAIKESSAADYSPSEKDKAAVDAVFRFATRELKKKPGLTLDELKQVKTKGFQNALGHIKTQFKNRGVDQFLEQVLEQARENLKEKIFPNPRDLTEAAISMVPVGPMGVSELNSLDRQMHRAVVRLALQRPRQLASQLINQLDKPLRSHLYGRLDPVVAIDYVKAVLGRAKRIAKLEEIKAAPKIEEINDVNFQITTFVRKSDTLDFATLKSNLPAEISAQEDSTALDFILHKTIDGVKDLRDLVSKARSWGYFDGAAVMTAIARTKGDLQLSVDLVNLFGENPIAAIDEEMGRQKGIEESARKAEYKAKMSARIAEFDQGRAKEVLKELVFTSDTLDLEKLKSQVDKKVSDAIGEGSVDTLLNTYITATQDLRAMVKEAVMKGYAQAESVMSASKMTDAMETVFGSNPINYIEKELQRLTANRSETLKQREDYSRSLSRLIQDNPNIDEDAIRSSLGKEAVAYFESLDSPLADIVSEYRESEASRRAEINDELSSFIDIYEKDYSGDWETFVENVWADYIPISTVAKEFFGTKEKLLEAIKEHKRVMPELLDE